MLDSISPVLIGWVGPLVILIPYTIVFGRWMQHPLRFAAFVYTLSIFTGILFAISGNVTDRESATIAGVYAPIVYALLFSCLSIFYRYIVRRELIEIAPDTVNILERLLLAGGGVISGLLIGGVIGLLVGAVLSFFLLAFFAINLFFRFGAIFTDQSNDLFLEAGIYLCGVIGAAVGGFLGAQVREGEED